ncbi:DUF2169 domain-containing protein [Piscinibacter sp. HJYY11]|uniref:DUF2169 family type VI secretion system accessory protein n=1 Tax=Piscinibacter sp. HJYY11 TaxID=2801333 RepID=UPI00191E0AAA|nr:DUF2169 domain-containing protein [Piscinibacter sp. HJYY11]MBL0726383.1 DUF2169 domain-containing protein [Piscinibacter sp. HJYY11]
MWHVANQTPFSADHGWVMDKAGNKIWLVVVKASFDVQPDGRCCFAAEQVPVLQVAQPYGEFGQSSLRYETDLAGVKATTDVLVRGDAMAPPGRLATSVEVSLTAGHIDKRLRVTGDRRWERGPMGLKISEPEPFERMPVVYERAFGGWDRSAAKPEDHRLEERNPVGTGFAVRDEHCDGLPLPNIEYPDQLISGWKDHPAPAGFNAVDVAWLPRRALAGTYDEKWRRTRFPLWAEDFDPRYHNAAPADQQAAGFFEGGERIQVTGMSERGTLAFDLPRLKFAFRTRFGSERIDQDGQLCTVLIEPNEHRVSLAWQSALVCNRRADELDETLVLQK